MAGVWRFRCAAHDETMPLTEYQRHCDEHHDGRQIAGYMLPPVDDEDRPAETGA